jgi:hypothetical protein
VVYNVLVDIVQWDGGQLDNWNSDEGDLDVGDLDGVHLATSG